MSLRTISLEQFQEHLGNGYEAFVRNIKDGPARVPDLAALKLGDVLLTAHRRASHPDAVRRVQRFFGMGQAHARWSHCMIYLGGGLVAETNPWSFDPDGTFHHGRIRERSLSAFARGYDLKVCRLSDEQFGEALRADVVTYAREQIAGPPVPYSIGRIIELLSNRKLPMDAVNGMICTDFVLQVLTIGGGQLPRLYAFHDKNARGMMPGHFSERRFFRRFELEHLLLDR